MSNHDDSSSQDPFGGQPATHAEDHELVQRVLRKERAAFDLFFDRYFGRLYRFCGTRIDDDAAVEDIVQVVLHKALRNLASYRGEASLLTWLCQICRHEIANWRAVQKRQGAEIAIDDHAEARAVLESLQVDRDDELIDRQRLVQLTLDHLPDHYGKALEWKYLEGLSVNEIAQRLRMNIVSVQSLLARARTAFRRGYLDLQGALEVNR